MLGTTVGVHVNPSGGNLGAGEGDEARGGGWSGHSDDQAALSSLLFVSMKQRLI